MNVERLDRRQVAENDCHHFVAEAASLGWRPGYWPRVLDTDLGNGRPLRFVRFSWNGSEVVCAHYQQDEGCVEVRVFND